MNDEINSAKKQINLLHVTSCLDIGGLEVLILNLLRNIDRGRYSPYVCTFEKGGSIEKEFKAYEIPVFVLEKKAGVDFLLPFKIAMLLRDKKIDIIHTHNIFSWIYGGVASILARSVVLVHTEHANAYDHWKMLRLAGRCLSYVSDRIIAVAKKVADVMINRDSISQNKIEVIYNGVDIEKYDKAIVDSDAHDRPGDKSKVTIGIVARLSRVKDHATLLRAFKIVVMQYPDVELIIIGDGDERDALNRLATDLNIGDKVRFLGARRDIPEQLKLLDIFVLSSISEGLPVTPIEAMAAHLPVIATDVGGNSEVVANETTGLIVPSKDPEKLAEAIIRLLKDRKLIVKMGEEGFERANSLFSLNKMVDRYQAVYEVELKKRRGISNA